MNTSYLPRRMALCGVLVVALLVVLAGCGGSSNAATNSPSPASTSTINVGATNASPSPTSTLSGATPTSAQSSPTATKTNPTPTPTRTIPTPTPTHATPTPTPKPNPSPTPKPPTPTPPPTSMNVTIVTNSTFAFSPQTLPIAVGTTVVWKNNTSAPHTVTSDNGAFGSGTISPGGTFSFKFTQAGTFAYHCSIHPFMTATIIVK
ncbi:MAG TPA: cupredoxin family copper-binding protein [Ktedonobacteraceae bacterium]|nr:cupredoxin family copper-binding protein [Ktedonobacteraceae bacterium]